ncbi:MAG: sodium-dependent transporter, partial [Bacteroidales bacterium]|nr:sodium-dependent transporter [Bacteroidales bacterium]
IVIIVVLIIRSVTLDGAGEGLRFLFHPDFSKITGKTVLSALGQAFFSLSLGMGTMITYGSYINKRNNLLTSAVQVSLTDTLIAVLAGMAIFPAVFAFGINPSEGEGLVFITLPSIFQQMAGGYFFAILFFVLLAIAALTSTISLLEVIVAYFSEELKMTRKRATVIAVVVIWFLGMICSLSQGPLARFTLFGLNFWDILDFTSTRILLPLGGLFIVLFVGYAMGTKRVRAELSNEGALKARIFPLVIFLIRFVAPIAIAMVFLNAIGILKIG